MRHLSIYLALATLSAISFYSNKSESIKRELANINTESIYHTISGVYSLNSQTDVKQEFHLLKDNNEIIKFVHFQNRAGINCELLTSNPNSQALPDGNFTYYAVNPEDSIKCSIKPKSGRHDLAVSYSLNVLKAVTSQEYRAQIDEAKAAISAEDYSEATFQKLKMLGVWEQLRKEVRITTGRDDMLRRIAKLEKGDYLELNINRRKKVGIGCKVSMNDCEYKGDFQGVQRNDPFYNQIGSNLAFAGYNPLEVICGIKDGKASFKEVIYNGTMQDYFSLKVNSPLYCAVNKQLNPKKKYRDLYGYYELNGIHINKIRTLNLLENLWTKHVDKVVQYSNTIDWRRFLLASNELKPILVDIKTLLFKENERLLDIEYRRYAGELRQIENERVTTLREAEIQFGVDLKNYKDAISSFVPWNQEVNLGESKYVVTIKPTRQGYYNPTVRYVLSDDYIEKRDLETGFVQHSKFVEYALLGWRAVGTNENWYGQKVPATQYEICHNDFSALRDDIADAAPITSGRILHDLFKRYDNKKCDTGTRHIGNYYLSLDTDENYDFTTQYCYDLIKDDHERNDTFKPTSMRTYYTPNIFHEDTNKHHYLQSGLATLLSNDFRPLRGKDEYCSAKYYGIFPVNSSLYLEDSYPRSNRSPMDIKILVDKKDIPPSLSRRLSKINQEYDHKRMMATRRYKKRVKRVNDNYSDQLNNNYFEYFYNKTNEMRVN